MVDAVQEPDHMYEYVTGLNVRGIDKMRHTINSKAYRKIQQTENSINVRWVRVPSKITLLRTRGCQNKLQVFK